MYKIVKSDGGTLSYTDMPHYIKISASNCFVEATQDDAIGIALNGEVFNLLGHDAISDAQTVALVRVDSGSVAYRGEVASADYDTLIAGIVQQLTELKI